MSSSIEEEIEMLQSIYGDELTVVSTQPVAVIEIRMRVDKAIFSIEFEMNEEMKTHVMDEAGLGKEEIYSIENCIERTKKGGEKNVFAIVSSVVEHVQSLKLVDEEKKEEVEVEEEGEGEEDEIIDDDDYDDEEIGEVMGEDGVTRNSVEGLLSVEERAKATPVTQESFAKWAKAFDIEEAKKKLPKKIWPGKMSGKEIFLKRDGLLRIIEDNVEKINTKPDEMEKESLAIDDDLFLELGVDQ